MPGEDHVYMGSVMCGRRQGFRNFVMHWRRFRLPCSKARNIRDVLVVVLGDEDIRNGDAFQLAGSLNVLHRQVKQ